MKRSHHLSDIYFSPTSLIRLLVLIAALSIGVLLSLVAHQADASPTRFPDDPYRTETFNMQGNAELEVGTSGGSIDVTGSSGNTMKVEMYVRERNRLLSIGDTDLSDYDITIEKRGNKVVAKAEYKGRRSWNNNNISISFVVHAPRTTSSNIHTSGGSLSIALLEGNQKMRTSGGSISVDDVFGNVDARTSGGSISIANMEGDLDAKTSGGSIDLNNITGTLDFSTSGGSMSLNKIAGQVDGHTSGGSIRADFTGVTGDITLRTSGGSINVNVPGDRGYNLDLRGNGVKTQLVNFSGEAEDDHIVGTMNGGGPKITLRTSGGRVKLRYL
ncbi:MAG: DUF4097 family beta strand repeat-containing protein [Bacteroidota bacterium]